MKQEQLLALETAFFHKRWPNGFECPRCAHGTFYTIRTRRLPLYQCRLCNHQTTVTAGTVMDRSRTPLDKWAAAIEILSGTNGINAVKLAAEIGVTHKTAWIMMRSFRRAIDKVESNRNLGNNIVAGLQVLGPYPLFFDHRYYQRERVVLISGSIDINSGEPATIALTPVSTDLLEPGRKVLSQHGVATLSAVHQARILRNYAMRSSPLRRHFKEAEQWIKRLFHGIRTASLQSYFNEYCFRWNSKVQGVAAQDLWFHICLRV